MEDVIYIADHMCVGQLLKDQYGNITPEYLYRVVAPSAPTGDTMLAVYDFDANEVYLAIAADDQIPAYNKSLFYLNMTQLFSF